jgi:hypothetical protein
MKIKIKKQIYWIFGGALSLVILLPVINPKAVFLMLFGYKYQSCGITTVSDGKNFSDNTPKQKVYIYKAGNKPFLLIGPYTFSPDCRDFFFVNKKQLIRTATDKGGGAFFQLASWLFVIDDMSGSYQKRVRAPWWDELKSKNASAVQKRDQYIYTLFLEDEKKYVTFSIPEKMLNCLVDGAEL